MSGFQSIRKFMTRDVDRFGIFAIRSKAICGVPAIVGALLASVIQRWSDDGALWVGMAGLAVTVGLLILYYYFQFSRAAGADARSATWRKVSESSQNG